MTGLPVFGICLGHQMLGLALGGKTRKMSQGHHGANHPVKDLETGKVEIVSMNHGFTVDRETLPKGVKETHVSLFDGTNCGIRVEGAPIFSVQYHPEASPGPMDSHYLFDRFAKRPRRMPDVMLDSWLSRTRSASASADTIIGGVLAFANPQAQALAMSRAYSGA